MNDQTDLFASAGGGERTPEGRASEQAAATADPGRQPDAPLASRLRPRRFSELVGQSRVAKVLEQLCRSGRLPSVVLWGPPGSGKTTLARIIAEETENRFASLSAVTSGVADLRRVIGEAKIARQRGRRTVLFIDEIHRFNKAQQDAVLPHVEDGTVTLIGATTENPSFEVNSALLSRSRVFRLEALTEEELDEVVGRGLGELGVEIEEDARQGLLAAARGDARIALNALETAVALVDGPITTAAVEQAMQQPHLLYDRAGDQHYDLISALIKSIRGSDADAAVYWLARMLEAGEDPMFIARRLVISASEDVGLADPAALPLAVAAQQASHFVGMPEALYALSETTIYLARAPKSNSGLQAYTAAVQAVNERGNLPVPLHLRNATTRLMRNMGYGKGYRYAHDYEGGTVEQQHLPDELAGTRFYEPNPRDRPTP
ncbi:MAG TPA: replication-associated recombination protein A [Candidatus Dormibacteraeota bacterium]|jgi:putative ATPase|nr:replication-associated recombination protein A [Candidatus Dormibacteraeota bacterium]